MPSPLADSVTTAIKRAVNIVDLVGEHVSLTRRGRVFKGLCPFHDDHNPSLDVDPERQLYRCWSCGAKGDIFDFLMSRERVDFREALESLARRARVPLPERPGAAAKRSVRDRILEVLSWAEGEFHRCLLSGEQSRVAREYATRRGLSQESVQAFRLGFAPNEWDWLLNRARANRYTPELLEQAGLVKRRAEGPGHYDRFRGRLMFPIRDARGRVIAFGGRILPEFDSGDGGKYLNSPETAIFTKGEHLYGLDRSRDAIVRLRTAVVVEGYTDCIMAHQHGLTHVVGTLGTALGPSHVSILKRYADRVILVYDGDEAGQRAADRHLALILSSEVDLRVVTLPDGRDPCDFVMEFGGPEFQRRLDSAVDALDFKLRRAGQLYDLSSISGRRGALDFVLTAVAAVPVMASGPASVTRDLVLDRVAQRVGLPPESVRKRLAELRKGQPRDRVKAPAEQAPPGPWSNESALERELLEVLLAGPELIPRVRHELDLQLIATPGMRRILELCFELIDEGKAVEVDELRQRLEDRELACRASNLAETGREKGALERRLADVLTRLQSRKPEEPEPEVEVRGDSPDSDEAKKRILSQRFHKALSRQRSVQRHA